VSRYALSGAVHTIMSLRMRGKQIVPAAAETIVSNESNPSPNNNFLQKLTMWGTLISDLFKVVMACLLSVFVPQNCPPSQTFDKEVRALLSSRAAVTKSHPRASCTLRSRLIPSLQYWHPCEVQENLTELDPYNSCVKSFFLSPAPPLLSALRPEPSAATFETAEVLLSQLLVILITLVLAVSSLL
jgi:hypothetical protein